MHSSFGFYGRLRGGELPGSWFVKAFASLRIEENAVRQTLHRMERNGEVESVRLGRDKLYRPTGFAWAAIDAGAAKLMGGPPAAWDGRWTIVQFQFSTSQRVARDRVGTILETEGFARLANGLFVHPRDRSERVCTAVAREGYAPNLVVFRGHRLDDATDEQFVARLWDLRELSRDYRAFLRRYAGVVQLPEATRDAFALRFALVLDYLEVAWRDPDLPAELLRADFPGAAAGEAARRLNNRLSPAARAFGDEILGEVIRGNASLTQRFANAG